jgi:hypothetical protein
MLKAIWNNKQVGDPVYQGLTLGGLFAGNPFVKADWPGARAIRLNNGAFHIVAQLPDSFPTPGTNPVEVWY